MGNSKPQVIEQPKPIEPVVVGKPNPPENNIDDPIKKGDPELDPMEQQVQTVFDELMQSINELDKDIEEMIKELREGSQQ
ncbi:unnamed protein product [Paramecium octaurelia]|uniref:Uncharacterized protein n=1 Tax=Paramecium octaurelia TaxID=43137 RepID=A0A8S1S7R6_PAROT|nr:unnamed protein product [Paramecium octaurelia]